MCTLNTRFELPLSNLIHPFPSLSVFQELQRRFKAARSTAAAFAVTPGVVHTDIYRTTPKLLMPIYEPFMRLVYLTADQGCVPSLCASTWPLERLSGEVEVKGQGEGEVPSREILAWVVADERRNRADALAVKFRALGSASSGCSIRCRFTYSRLHMITPSLSENISNPACMPINLKGA